MPPGDPQPSGRGPRLIALAVALAAGARVLAFGLLDLRPRYGGSEANDLYALARYHWAIRGWLGDEFATFLLEDRYKPPLWYGGVSLLGAWSPALHYWMVLAAGAAALVLALAAAWVLGSRMAGPRAGCWAVVIAAALPGVAGRVTIAGVEPLHMALLGWALVGLLDILTRPRTSSAIVLGCVLCAGMLAKWTFAAAVLGPVAVAAWAATAELRGRTGTGQASRDVPEKEGAGKGASRRPPGLLALALGTAALPFFGWLLAVGQAGVIAAGAASDPTTSALIGSDPLLYLPAWLLRDGIGLAGLPLLALGLAGSWLARNREAHLPAALLAAAVVGLLCIHMAIPHKEVRYLLPAFLPLAVLAGRGLAGLTRRGRTWRAAAAAATLLLLASTFGWPLSRPARSSPGQRERDLHLHIVRDDGGLAALAARIVQGDRVGGPAGPVVVASSLSGERWMELRDMLAWELYDRPASPALLLPPAADLRWAHARRRLEAADCFLIDRPPSTAETGVLAGAGFARDGVLALRVPGGERVELWTRAGPAEPR